MATTHCDISQRRQVWCKVLHGLWCDLCGITHVQLRQVGAGHTELKNIWHHSTQYNFTCTHAHTHARTHTSILRPSGLCPRLPGWASNRTNVDFTEARDSEWQWHQLGHMQIYTSHQTDNHASTTPLSFYRPDWPKEPCWVYKGATWWIRLNDPCSVVKRAVATITVASILKWPCVTSM